MLISHIENLIKCAKSQFLADFNEEKLQNDLHRWIFVKIRKFGLDLEKICQNSGIASKSIVRVIIATKLEILA